VHALLEGIPSETTPVVAVIKQEPGSPLPAKLREQQNPSNYNPSMIYILELSSMIAIKNTDHGGAVSKDVVEALQDVIRSSNGMHPLVVSRAAFYLLHVLNANYDQTFMRAPVILHTISGLDRSIAEKAALPILKGLSLCLQNSRPLRNEIINIPDFWSTIRGLHSIPDAAPSVFELIVSILEDSPSSVTADNYEAIILLLNDFATAGSAGAIIEQKRDRHARRPNRKSLDARY
jgi:golgi-specific brefeldin A-resistance guanine nucleotide exchange factor 1